MYFGHLWTSSDPKSESEPALGGGAVIEGAGRVPGASYPASACPPPAFHFRHTSSPLSASILSTQLILMILVLPNCQSMGNIK